MVRLTKQDCSGYSIYFDEVNNRKYGRIVMGLSWPRGDGFVCVVAAGLVEEIGTEQKPYYLLDETFVGDLDGLLHRCIELKEIYLAESIYGFRDEIYMQLLSEWNRRRQGAPRVFIKAPAFSESNRIEYFINLLKDKLYPNKHLHFQGNSRLPGLLAAIPAEIKDITCDIYPAVAALGYAVAGLNSWSGGEYRPKVAEYEDNPLA